VSRLPLRKPPLMISQMINKFDIFQMGIMSAELEQEEGNG
jgi:hypothetical protein